MELRAHLLREDPLYTRTGRQQSLNLEFLMEKEYLAVSCLASVRAQMLLSLALLWKRAEAIQSGSLLAGAPASLPLKSFPC